ncbi:leucine--tRNA ligase [Actinoplanes sp. NPDC026619]|uniref:leucine--tRNA ligase n=1 Tax=Actinoplanes sp. NPDC026619 TaxID=3155798 RepID=UPI0033FDA261
MSEYDFHAMQARWLPVWESLNLFASHDPAREKRYLVDMFAYPSGDLHMGHAEAYAIGDAVARYWTQQGFDVLHPVGWDSFGLPAENAAIRRNQNPADWTYANIATQAESFRRYATSIDWSTRLHTSDPSYYRWTQWLFLRFFERGLAYRAEAPVNWCPADQTVLANEQVVGGRCERCGSEVTTRSLTQWFFRTTAYADRLLADMSQLEGHWPAHILTMQRNWIGQAPDYHLRDWLISRQRYWGCPIPIVHCHACGEVPVPDDELPVRLPDLRGAALSPRGVSPLAAATDWVAVSCPSCGGPAERDTDTLDTFVDSSWYFLRYPNPAYDQGPFDPAAVRPVDQYFGGPEHAVMHLLYARFFTKVLYDLGLVDFTEPFRALTTQGHVILNGAAMSKSKGNMVDLGAQIATYGVDAIRLAMVFAGPPEEDIDWADISPGGSVRFLSRALSLTDRVTGPPAPAAGTELRRTTHRLLRLITELIEARRLNVAVARLMELVTAAREAPADDPARRETVEAIAVVLSLFAPYTAEEMWSRLGHPPGVAKAGWPAIDPALAAERTVICAVQVNGKVRDRLEVPGDITEADLTALALASPAIAGRPVTRTIVRAPKLVNVVVPGP